MFNKNIRPWLVMIAVGIVSATCLSSSMVLMGSFLSSLSNSMHVSVATISYYYTILVLMMAIMTPFIPKILKKVNNTLVYLVCSILVTISLLTISHITNIWMFFALAIVIGASISFMSFVPVGILIGNWFNEKVGLATGICWAITSVYVGIMSPLLSTMIGSMGWKNSLTILAIIVGVMSIPCTFLIKFTPELANSKAYGVKKEVNEKSSEALEVSTNSILTSSAFWIVFILSCVLQFPAVLNQMYPTYATSVGFSATVGGFMVTAAMIFDIFLNPIVGMTADKFGAEKSSAGWLIVGLVSCILLILATNSHSASLAILSAGINDVMYVFLGTGLTSLAQSIFGPNAFAKGFSIVSSASFVIGAFAMPLNNMIAEKMGGFNSVFTFFGIIALVSAFLVLVGAKHHFNSKKSKSLEMTLSNK